MKAKELKKKIEELKEKCKDQYGGLVMNKYNEEDFMNMIALENQLKARQQALKEVLDIIKDKRGKMCGNSCCDCLRLVETKIKEEMK